MTKKRSSILLMFFVLGACSVTCQATLVREFLTVFSGNELCLGAFFSLWLFWVSMGAAIGAAVARLRRGQAALLVAFSVLCAASMFPQIYAVRSVREIFDLPIGLLLSFKQMMLFSLCCLAPFSLLTGLSFPIGCRLYAESAGRKPSGIGWVYISECLGFLFGGVLFSFVVVYHYNASVIAASLLLALSLAGLVVIAHGSRVATRVACAAAGLALVGAAWGLLPALRRFESKTIERRWESLKTGSKLLAWVDSKYENLAIGEREGQYEVFASGCASFAFPDEYQFPAVANYVTTQHPNPKSMLIVGHAVHGLLREFLRTGIERLEHVELDPAVVKLVKPYLPEADLRTLRDPRVRRYYGDGRYFVKTCRRHYDIIFVNVPDPSTAMLNRYYTREFYAELKRILNPGGVVAITASSAANYVGEIMGDFTSSIFHTFRQEFKYVVMSPGDHCYIFGSNSPHTVTNDPLALMDRFEAKGVEYETFKKELFILLFPRERTKSIWREMMARDPVGPPPPPKDEDALFVKPGGAGALKRRPAKINTDLKPVSYFYNLLMWDKYTSSNLQRFFRSVERLRLSAVLAALAGLVLLRRVYVGLLHKSRDSQIRFNGLASIVVCGMSSMAFDILLLLAYQNLFGYLYHMIGLLVALFMLGLAVGATLMNVALPRVRQGTRSLIGLELALAVYAFALPSLLAGASALIGASAVGAQVAFMALVVVAGVIAGAQFPLVSKLYFERSSGAAVASGLVDSADHLGACVGAFASGTVFIPILGIVVTCALIGAFNLACVVLVLLTALKRAA